MSALTSSLIVKLINQVSAPAKQVAASIRGIGQAFSGLSSKNMMAGLDAAIKRNNQSLEQMRGRLLESVATFYILKRAIAAPLDEAAKIETLLEDIGQKADIPVARLGALGEELKKIGRQTNQTSTAIGGAVDSLLGRGASEQVALAAAVPIGKAAFAYRAAADDLAAASWAAVDNLKVPADRIGSAIDMMAVAGKEGAFELRDMAKYFPALGAAYQGLGQKGTSAVGDLAAALQIVRKGTGDSASAATNLKNVLQKTYAPDTIKKFKKQGIDLRREMKKRLALGETPIEALANITNKALKGDLSKLGDLFQDAQVQEGMRSLIQNMDEYKRIRAEALKANGVTDVDFKRRQETALGAQMRFAAVMERFNQSVGVGLLPVVNQLLDTLIPVIDAFGSWAQANPQLVSGIVIATTALIGFRAAAFAVRFATLQAKGGILELASGFLRIGRFGGKTLTAPFRGFARVVGVAGNASAGQAKKLLIQRQAAYRSALELQNLAKQGKVAGLSFKQATANVRTSGMALTAAQQAAAQAGVRSTTTFGAMGRGIGNLLNPLRLGKAAFSGIGGALRGLKWLAGGSLFGMAAFAGLEWLSNNWKGLVEFCTSFGTSFMNALGPAKPVVEAISSAFSSVYDWISKLLGPIDETGAKWRGWGEAAGGLPPEKWSTLKYVFET